jgi:hypothetical protein
MSNNCYLMTGSSGFQGVTETGTVLPANITAAGGDSAIYGLANWHYYNGRQDEAKAGFEEMTVDSATIGSTSGRVDALDFPAHLPGIRNAGTVGARISSG